MTKSSAGKVLFTHRHRAGVRQSRRSRSPRKNGSSGSTRTYTHRLTAGCYDSSSMNLNELNPRAIAVLERLRRRIHPEMHSNFCSTLFTQKLCPRWSPRTAIVLGKSGHYAAKGGGPRLAHKRATNPNKRSTLGVRQSVVTTSVSCSTSIWFWRNKSGSSLV